MDRDRIIKICLVLYKATEGFPKQEPLKASLRQKANEILADFILGAPKILKDIEVIKAYFKLAKEQKWVDEVSFNVLEKEYNVLYEQEQNKQNTDKESAKEKLAITPKSENVKFGRHKKILDVLSREHTAQIKDLQKFFPKLTKRTLRRDFDKLMTQGLVERVGQGNMTVYKLR